MIKETIFNAKTKEIKEIFLEDNNIRGENYTPLKTPLEEKVDTLEEELCLTQNAVDCLIMAKSDISMLSLFISKNLAAYLAMRISKGMLNYDEVVELYPELAEDIKKSL